MSYQDPAGREPEKLYHGFILGLLVQLEADYEVRSNRESSYGRADVLVRPRAPGRPGVVLELKVPQRDETPERALLAAARQVRDRRYAAELLAAGASPVHEIVAVFDGKRAWARKVDERPCGARTLISPRPCVSTAKGAIGSRLRSSRRSQDTSGDRPGSLELLQQITAPERGRQPLQGCGGRDAEPLERSLQLVLRVKVQADLVGLELRPEGLEIAVIDVLEINPSTLEHPDSDEHGQEIGRVRHESLG
jgi:hypothetical protein